MNVELISEDRDLLKLCREVLADISDEIWHVSQVVENSVGQNADLWLWDYCPGLVLSKEVFNHSFKASVPRSTTGSSRVQSPNRCHG